MQVEEAPSERNKDGESKHQALCHHISVLKDTGRPCVCACESLVCVSLGVVTHTAAAGGPEAQRRFLWRSFHKRSQG